MEREKKRLNSLRRAIISPRDSSTLKPRAFPEEHLAITAALLAHLNKLPDYQQLQKVEKRTTDHPAVWLLFYEDACVGMLCRNLAEGDESTSASYLLFNPASASGRAG